MHKNSKRPTCASCFPFDNCQLHVFDLDPHKKKINLTHDYILQVISG